MKRERAERLVTKALSDIRQYPEISAETVEALKASGLGGLLLDAYSTVSDAANTISKANNMLLVWDRKNDPPPGAPGEAFTQTLKDLSKTVRQTEVSRAELKKLAEWITGRNVR